MISKLRTVNASVNVPVGYPGEDNDKHMEDIRKFVEETPHNIGVNGAYHAAVYEKHCRAGYNFRFWFEDESAAKEFSESVNGKLEVPPVMPKGLLHLVDREDGKKELTVI